MPDRRDDLDSWLDGRISPLPPPPGTFELIKRRARRRKYRRLGVTAGVAAVIVAAAVTVPQMVILPSLNTTSAAGAAKTSPASPTAAVHVPPGAAASGATPITTPAPPPVPANFQPTSVTFIGLYTGWVIGQAGTPGHCATQYCTSVARTGNAGQTWQGGPAPLAGPAAGATGVSQIRFLNLDNGWAFGPELFATHDGGQTWTQVSTDGMRVIDLETVGDRAFALFASCSGSGPAFGAACTSDTLYSSPASANDWAPVGAATSGLSNGTGQDGAASIVLTGAFGYLLGPNRMLYTGPVDGSAPWQAVASVPCATGSALADGQPAGALLAAATATSLILACTPPPVSSGLQKKLIFSSANGGVSWQRLAVAPVAGVTASVAASLAGTVVLGTDQGIDVLPAGAGRWQQAIVAGAPAGGFSYVGMTSASQGVAVPADPSAGAVWFTFDGGQSWQPSSVRSS